MWFAVSVGSARPTDEEAAKRTHARRTGGSIETPFHVKTPDPSNSGRQAGSAASKKGPFDRTRIEGSQVARSSRIDVDPSEAASRQREKSLQHMRIFTAFFFGRASSAPLRRRRKAKTRLTKERRLKTTSIFQTLRFPFLRCKRQQTADSSLICSAGDNCASLLKRARKERLVSCVFHLICKRGLSKIDNRTEKICTSLHVQA